MHSVFSFSTSLPLLLPRVIFVSFPGSQLPMLAKIWYIKIYHLSVLLLSSIALFIFTSYHQALPFFILFSFSRDYFFSSLYLALNFYFGKKKHVLFFNQPRVRWDFNIYSKVLPIDFTNLWKPSFACHLDNEITDALS